MLTKNQIIHLLAEKDESVVRILLDQADRIRRVFVGNDVHLLGLIEFSNYCRRDCFFCCLRKSNKRVVRYRMTNDEILAAVVQAENQGFKTVVLQSGEDHSYTLGGLSDLVRKIKLGTGIAVTLSIGERSYRDYKRLREAGVDHYLLRCETSNPHLFKSLKPDFVYGDRFQWLMEIGYQVGSWNIVGLPGQSIESIADDILKFNELKLDMVILDPYISHLDTPLHDSANGTIDSMLRVTALTRIVTKNANITATDAIDPQGRQKALQCGANVLMLNATPLECR